MSTDTLTFTINFHGPFHVGSGVPSQGLDRVLDRQVLLPATSLKGLMRATAAEVLGMAPGTVNVVFGTFGPNVAQQSSGRRIASPWNWGDARPEGPVSIHRGARISVTEQGSAERGFLMLGENAWVRQASFTVSPTRQIPADALSTQRLVLRGSARAVTSLGGGRTRGDGWVTITDELAWTDQDSADLLKLRVAAS